MDYPGTCRGLSAATLRADVLVNVVFRELPRAEDEGASEFTTASKAAHTLRAELEELCDISNAEERIHKRGTFRNLTGALTQKTRRGYCLTGYDAVKTSTLCLQYSGSHLSITVMLLIWSQYRAQVIEKRSKIFFIER